MSSDLSKVREMIVSNESYRRERQDIFNWAITEEKRNDKENPCTGQSQDGPNSVGAKRISRELNRRLDELDRKYGITG